MLSQTPGRADGAAEGEEGVELRSLALGHLGDEGFHVPDAGGFVVEAHDLVAAPARGFERRPAVEVDRLFQAQVFGGAAAVEAAVPRGRGDAGMGGVELAAGLAGEDVRLEEDARSAGAIGQEAAGTAGLHDVHRLHGCDFAAEGRGGARDVGFIQGAGGARKGDWHSPTLPSRLARHGACRPMSPQKGAIRDSGGGSGGLRS